MRLFLQKDNVVKYVAFCCDFAMYIFVYDCFIVEMQAVCMFYTKPK